ncbi:hypothetical protein NPA07_00875 [Mycoplasmopsis caviae]|uniref:Uncharacterized protein n=1 Tax=Mycoplasmopsis caviae TaxID=55603 RepID=A0ABY5J0F8_9BACT|nr:hypothetical protein [Mycoplasmopsis caviae]UUD34804.1 hypothetical protein NPA07_03205 [Mycoplasmopsis caviae]UUD35152.1 hypothetical protein NPA07_05100 [Mycoplasmopsis caviae]UUD35162.1 hypothetical protein NPA07_05155 [Mycoplasmopsis caviae]UUD35414.1 hypothetical protein NPA07_00875 [Mycoplasmopsis caviae]
MSGIFLGSKLVLPNALYFSITLVTVLSDNPNFNDIWLFIIPFYKN